MKRRAFTSLLAGGLSLGAGCAALDDGNTRIYDEPEIDSVEFSTEPTDEAIEPPVVTFPDERTVHVTGTAVKGTPCHELALDSVTFHQPERKLYTLVVPARLHEGCPDSEGAERYDLGLTFASQPPRTVTAEHRDIRGQTYSVTTNR